MLEMKWAYWNALIAALDITTAAHTISSTMNQTLSSAAMVRILLEDSNVCVIDLLCVALVWRLGNSGWE